VRKENKFFGVEGLLGRRSESGVGDDVIKIVGTGGTGKAEVIDL